MPLAINEFIYIPPHEWEKHKQLAALLREAYPEMALPQKLTGEKSTATAPVCAQCRCQSKSAKPVKETTPVMTSPLKRRAAQSHNQKNTETTTSTSTSNTTTFHNSGISRSNKNYKNNHSPSRSSGGWTSLGHGFWYTPGPSVTTPWWQWTWLEMTKRMARWLLVCCILYVLVQSVKWM
ncbi:hypothetical protein Sste5346_005550 [Sporothrix stenoceras]|uniref:Uncharacterized protein n=1 Tax=Sporothrix stenoceras TaxID=5173 RepID=A0ABR3Z2L0_9PEZI